MATISKLKTVDGKYYATEDFVNSQIDKKLDHINEVESFNELISSKLDPINEVISGKADASEVYTKQQVEVILSNLFSMNTIE